MVKLPIVIIAFLDESKQAIFSILSIRPYITVYFTSGALDPSGPLEARSGEVPILQTGPTTALHCAGWRDALPALSLVPSCTPVPRMYCRYSRVKHVM